MAYLLLLLSGLNVLSMSQGNNGYAGNTFDVIIMGEYPTESYKHKLHVTRADYINEQWTVDITNNITETFTVDDMVFIYNLTVESDEAIKTAVNVSAAAFVRVETYVLDSPTSLRLVNMYSCIPSSNLGNEYYVITNCHNGDFCQISLTGTGSDNISLNMTLSSFDAHLEVIYQNQTYKSGDTIQLQIEQYQVRTLKSLQDLTGTRIQGSAPFVTFSGEKTNPSENTNITNSIRQLPPVSSFGKYFTVYSQNTSQGDLLKMLVVKADTEIEISSSDPFIVVNPGTWIQRFMKPGQSRFIFSNKPVLVFQYEMVEVNQFLMPRYESTLIIPPIEQWSKNNKFGVLIDGHHSAEIMTKPYQVSIFTHSADMNKIRVNGSENNFGSTSSIEKSSYKVNTITIQTNDTYVTNITLDEAVAWGYVSDVYRFPFYSELQILESTCQRTEMIPGDFIDNDCDGYTDEDDCISNITDAESDCALKYEGKVDHLGTEFFITFLESHGTDVPSVSLYFSTNNDNEVTVHVSLPLLPGAVWNETFSIKSGRGHNITKSSDTVQTTDDTKGIYIVSDSDISVSGMTAYRYSASAFLALPKDALGLDYISFTDCNGSSRPCGCALVATLDNTSVDVLFPFDRTIDVLFNNRSFRQGEVLHVVLNKFYVFQIQAAVNQDLTGSRIRSDKPIAVFCGGSPYDGHVMEQLPPIITWGRHFRSPSIPTCTKCRLNIIMSQDNTEINLSDPSQNTTVVSNKYYHFYLAFTGDLNYEIITSKPVMVVLSLNGNNISGDLRNPIMVIIPPIKQFIQEQSLYVPNSPIKYFLGITNGNDTSNVFVDGSVVEDRWVNITTGDHFINSSFRIFAFILGLGETAEGFPWNIAFPVGMKLLRINQLCKVTNTSTANDTVDNDCDGRVDEEICFSDLENSEDPDLSVVSGYTDCFQEVEDHDAAGSIIWFQRSSSSETGVESSKPNFTNDERNVTSTDDASNDIIGSSVATQGILTNRISSTMSETEPSSVTDISTSGITNSDQSPNGACNCPCSKKHSDIKTADDVQRLIEKIKKELTVDKSRLSSTVRKLTSADDKRTSAKTMGYFGIALIVSTFGSIILLDLPTLIRHICKMKNNILKCLKYKK